MMQHINEIRTIENFDDIQCQWNDCIDVWNGKTVFLTHSWFKNFIENNIDGSRRDFFILFFTGGHGINSIFPALIKKELIHKVNLKAITFLSNFYSPHCSIVNCDYQDGLPRIMRQLEKQSWDVMILNDIREHTGEYNNFTSALTGLQIPYIVYNEDENWYLPCENLTFENFLKIKGKNVEKKWRYEKRRLEKMDQFRFHMQTANDDKLWEYINAYYKVYENSWKAKEPYPEFHRSLMITAAEKGWLRLGTIKLGDNPVASQIWLVFNNTASILKVAYHEKFKKYSPGSVLTLLMIEHVLEKDRVNEIDFLKGSDIYKQQWMSEYRKQYTLLIYNKRSVKGRLLWYFDQFIYPVLKKIGSKKRALVQEK